MVVDIDAVLFYVVERQDVSKQEYEAISAATTKLMFIAGATE